MILASAVTVLCHRRGRIIGGRDIENIAGWRGGSFSACLASRRAYYTPFAIKSLYLSRQRAAAHFRRRDR